MTNDTDHYGSDRCVSMTDEGLTLKTVVLTATTCLLSQRSTAPSSLQPFSKPFGWQGSGSSGRRLLSFWYFSFWPRRKKKYIAYVNDTFIGKMGKRNIFPRDVGSLFWRHEKNEYSRVSGTVLGIRHITYSYYNQNNEYVMSILSLYHCYL